MIGKNVLETFRRKNIGKQVKKKKKVSLAAVAVLTGGGALFILLFRPSIPGMKMGGKQAAAVNTAQVTKMDLREELSSAGTLKPKNTYNVTSLAEGQIIEADFEEGNQVEQGQVLYKIDSSSMKSELDFIDGNMIRAQKAYETAQKDMQMLSGKFGGKIYRSSETGYIKTLHVKEGDRIGSGTKIADLYDDQHMRLKLPFLSEAAGSMSLGSQAVVTLAATQEQLAGTVTAVSGKDEVLTGGRMVRYVTIEVVNPGGLTATLSATATVGEAVSGMEGTFTPVMETVMTADIPDSVVLEKLLVAQGDYVSPGREVFSMDGQSADKIMRSSQEALDRAQESMESAKSRMDSTQNNLENYTITAPIAGTVIKKNSKEGDKISKSGETSIMAVIYDLSTITFVMSIDELDVKKVKVGQRVEIQADAMPEQIYYGTIQNVSLESNHDKGVSTYPVTVAVEKPDGLLPGMNVNGKILLKEERGVLSIPVDALMRGNVVYVKDPAVKEAKGDIPPGFREVSVETGMITNAYVEIKSGLNEGDEIYRSPETIPTYQNEYGEEEMMDDEY